MNLRSLFRRRNLEPEWTFTADAILWRLLCAEGGRIVGECRDQVKKCASFFCIDETTGCALWKQVRLEELWWVGMEAVLGDLLLLHGYAKPDMPQHRGIRAIDLKTGRERWRNDDVTYWFATRGSICAYKDFFEKRVAYELDQSSGDVVRSFEGEEAALLALREQAVENQVLTGVLAPMPFEEGASSEAERTSIAKALNGAKPAASIECIRKEQIFAFSHTVSDNRGDKSAYHSWLTVIRQSEGITLFSDVIGSNLSLPAPDTFFVKGERLLFLKQQTSLVSLRPWLS